MAKQRTKTVNLVDFWNISEAGINIIISEDLTKIELKERKVLVVVLKEARNNNQNAKLRRNKIIIEGVEYTASDIEKTITDAQLFDNIPIRKIHSEPPTPSHKEFVEEVTKN
ncbi:unnamed protein product [Psylliodes chrysocephalus]|uniref:Uncharacterized protein n=1 Tax=Psylliodes chrysocephalus TaxID=3402493 RepID=A0A9P0CNQ0_9CUCU|nr:unnamed protein product [Psylliodes chrysocephala]